MAFTENPVKKLSAYAEKKRKTTIDFFSVVLTSVFNLKKKNLSSHYGHKCIPLRREPGRGEGRGGVTLFNTAFKS